MSNSIPPVADGPVTTKVAMTMEESLQGFAVRAACFIGELDVPYTEEFDGHDFSATHVIAYVGEEPVGTVRLRWFQSFAMPERLCVVQRYRGRDIGNVLIERCRMLAERRGCNMLYTQSLPRDLGYFEKQGWRRLVPESADESSVIAVIRPVDPSKPLPNFESPEMKALGAEPRLDASGMPAGSLAN
jgi:GNAT superfamily N-acetyltransferase